VGDVSHFFRCQIVRRTIFEKKHALANGWVFGEFFEPENPVFHGTKTMVSGADVPFNQSSEFGK